MRNPRDLLLPWHDGYGLVSPETRVYFVGPNVAQIKHVHRHKEGKSIDVDELVVLEKPQHNANPAGYCRRCNVLYVGIDPPKETDAYVAVQ